MEDKTLGLVKYIKDWWYKERGLDIYNTNDFDELWGTEEQEKPLTSRFIEHSIKKETGIGHQIKYKENINKMENSLLTSQSEVIVVEPRAFDEALDIVEQLKCRKSVVLNLHYLDSEESQRVVDFLAGATHAIEGHQQRVGQGVFIFAPNNFVLSSESTESRALKDAFWNKAKGKEKEVESQFSYEELVKKSSIF